MSHRRTPIEGELRYARQGMHQSGQSYRLHFQTAYGTHFVRINTFGSGGKIESFVASSPAQELHRALAVFVGLRATVERRRAVYAAAEMTLRILQTDA